jgi:uncharacterized membrane protein
MSSFRFDQIEVVIGKWFVWGPLLLVCVALGLLNVLPHMHEAIWQDEAATIAFHASRGVIDPFIHYNSPNSHLLFTSLLAAWMKMFPNGLDVFTLRLLPVLLFLAAIPATFAAGYRLGGAACGSLAAVLFASSVVSANFASQLRGYGPSWLFLSLALLCALGTLAAGSKFRWWQLGYFLSGMAAIALLPTNVYFLMAISACFCVAILAAPASASGKKREAVTILLAAPVLGLFGRLARTDELREHGLQRLDAPRLGH